ncbi:MAG: saccharopine dehydrogenase [Bacteroidetes bacterium GWC2_33_15]|nr:MAG: saccharopine dehydrogenase [Bacteroidetes bacterium GWA2_33_15]OFX50157.1 MAG: saccharopine dehydrogenase [Bacteroidetes bacterium GWC2_33_15]OFX65309.1 MAG: saccharopine dehydrogenase [Bacteroidetes bacterium GWB2_32_14]OFX70536.1 MAG: saccharopine dehydrogenase [Bacteroidetes bacterium GWD2_33_33]HAN19590.1 saccharopine dehydrogenase [Bacteroidales bacterium]
MKKILILGAGLSSSSMIKYMLDHSEQYNWKVRVGDMSLEVAKRKIANHKNGEAFEFDIFNEKQRHEEIQKADVVISMLPARFHYLAAEKCVEFGKHMVTASYVSKEIKAMHDQALAKNILLLNEIGVDPGIDHMSAMKVIDEIKAKGGELISFKSSTGGLVAPEYDNNPWNYKFTWNPRNVVVAGQSVAQYIDHGQLKFIPYHKLFTRSEKMSVLDLGDFEMYPNRDSLSYREVYDLQNIQTLLRGTLRRPGYCAGWNVFVQLGATDDTYVVENSENMTYRDFTNSFLPFDEKDTVEQKLAKYVGIDLKSETMKRLEWLGIFEKRKIGLPNATPAQILQKLLEEKWALGPEDKDLIVMQHEFIFKLKGKTKRITSSLIVRGQDTVHTAMSITVGIPVAIATKLLLTGVITKRGVVIPIMKDVYLPVLNELKEYGIDFIEEEQDLD